MKTAIQAGMVISIVVAAAAVTANARASQVCYSVRVQGDTQFRAEVCDGSIAGTTGQGKRLEQIKIRGMEPSANMCYKVHVEGTGWSSKKCQNSAAGTVGKRIEAIEILDTTLTVDQSVYYQSHIQNEGWVPLRWDGGLSGTTGRSLRMEAIAIAVGVRSPCPDVMWYGFSGYASSLISFAADSYPGQTITCDGADYSNSSFFRNSPFAQYPIGDRVYYLGGGHYDLYAADGNNWSIDLDRYNNITDAWWILPNYNAIHLGAADRNWAVGSAGYAGVTMQ